MSWLLALLTAVFALAAGALTFKKARDTGSVSRRTTLYATLAGGLVAALCVVVERWVLRATGLAFEVQSAGVGGALMAVFLLAAPLEEAAKVLVVWPLYRTRRIRGVRSGLCYAVATAAGFAAVEGAIQVRQAASPGLGCARALLGVFAHLFFAGAWGFALGAGRMRGRWFSLTWFSAVLLHALYDHIVWGRGPGYLAATLPMLGFMAFGAWAALREIEPQSIRHTRLEPPSLRDMRAALRPAERPLMLRWVVVGAFVTLGLILSFSVASVFVGRHLGIDFTLADEADVRSSGPLALLGTGVLVAFPVAGFLIARASSTHSMLEPALATLLSLAAVVVLLAATAPVAVLFALALVPIATGLACGGAWFALEH
ncbi:MAG: PrsW family glutamic-type intramembrane protease [Polyangiaceae bacterium]